MSQADWRGEAHGEAPRASSTTWPHQLSHDATLRVGDVLGALERDFPSLSPSKLRFLDAQGLVIPSRTPGGYRAYSASDVERVRYVLRQQRDAYTPLVVIKARLDELDAGTAHEPLSLAAVAHGGQELSIEEVAAAAGIATEVVNLLATEGIVRATAPGRFDRGVVPLVKAAARYVAAGADVRELRSLVRVAEREVEAARSAAAPLARLDDAVRVESAIAERSEAAAEAFAAAVRSAAATRE